jgi:hypothetical protein
MDFISLTTNIEELNRATSFFQWMIMELDIFILHDIYGYDEGNLLWKNLSGRSNTFGSIKNIHKFYMGLEEGDKKLLINYYNDDLRSIS